MKDVFFGKFETESPEDDVIVNGEKFSIDPRMIEMEEYKGTHSMRQLVFESGLKYIRVKCLCNGQKYIFTN